MNRINRKVMLASGNQGKLKELQALLADVDIEVVAQPVDKKYEVEETGTTFVENAIIKARHACAISGLPCIADDSGLIVESLAGAPGVRTARYAGETADSQDNMNFLMRNLHAFQEKDQRKARFVCVVVFMRHKDDPLPIIASGQWQGFIHNDKCGNNGFGYDPIFWDETHQMTAAQMTAEQKANMSHRAQACRSLKQQLEQLWRS